MVYAGNAVADARRPHLESGRGDPRKGVPRLTASRAHGPDYICKALAWDRCGRQSVRSACISPPPQHPDRSHNPQIYARLCRGRPSRQTCPPCHSCRASQRLGAMSEDAAEPAPVDPPVDPPPVDPQQQEQPGAAADAAEAACAAAAAAALARRTTARRYNEWKVRARRTARTRRPRAPTPRPSRLYIQPPPTGASVLPAKHSVARAARRKVC